MVHFTNLSGFGHWNKAPNNEWLGHHHLGKYIYTFETTTPCQAYSRQPQPADFAQKVVN